MPAKQKPISGSKNGGILSLRNLVAPLPLPPGGRSATLGYAIPLIRVERPIVWPSTRAHVHLSGDGLPYDQSSPASVWQRAEGRQVYRVGQHLSAGRQNPTLGRGCRRLGQFKKAGSVFAS